MEEKSKKPFPFEKSQYYLKWLTSPHSKDEKLIKKPKSKTQTELGILCTCLNLGINPPDVVKPNPCSTLECWVDPKQYSKKTALLHILTNLEKQFKSCEPRSEYIVSLDPTISKLKKICNVQRRTENNGRIFFYYNGHGVPRPSKKGEIWVFNENYTQYIPLLIKELKLLLGFPSIYVFDCNYAGILVDSFLDSGQRRKKNQNKQQEQEQEQQKKNQNMKKDNQKQKKNQNQNQKQKQKQKQKQSQQGFGQELTKNKILSNIALFSCSNYEDLPTDPKMPADLFTSCLTTPIKTALRWHICSKFSSDTLLMNVNLETIENIPGNLNKSSTVLGELKQIFISITECIAWSTLPNDLFQKLYRQDLLVATLFQNYLLAERIMKSYNCTPVTIPVIPETYKHELWNSWDFVVDTCLSRINSNQNQNQSQSQSLIKTTNLNYPFYKSFQLNNKFNSKKLNSFNNFRFNKNFNNQNNKNTIATLANNRNNKNKNIYNFNNLLVNNLKNNKKNEKINFQKNNLNNNLNIKKKMKKQKFKKKKMRKKFKTMDNQKENETFPKKDKQHKKELNLKKNKNNHLKSKQYIKTKTLLFFDDQLTSFEVWINSGLNKKTGINKLPILLHTILNSLYSQRTFLLLSRFFDLGRWAISEALNVGFLPYLKKFFKPNYKISKNLFPNIIFCWAKTIVFYQQQYDLTSILDSKSYKFFFKILTSKGFEDELYSLSAFVLVQMQDSFHKIKNDCLSLGLLDVCYSKLDHSSPNIRKWNSFCIAKQCENYQRAKNRAIQIGIHKKLLSFLIEEKNPEIRSTYVYTLASIIGISNQKDEDFVKERKLKMDKIIILNVISHCINDGSYLVRNECLLFLIKVIVYFEENIKLIIRIGEKSRLNNDYEEQRFWKLWGFQYRKIIEKLGKIVHNVKKKKNPINSSPLSIELNKHKIIKTKKKYNHKNFANRSKFKEFEKNTNLLFANSLWKSLLQFCKDPFPRIYHMAIEVTQLFLYYWDDYSKIDNNGIFSDSFNNIFIRNSRQNFNKNINLEEFTKLKKNITKFKDNDNSNDNVNNNDKGNDNDNDKVNDNDDDNKNNDNNNDNNNNNKNNNNNYNKFDDKKNNDDNDNSNNIDSNELMQKTKLNKKRKTKLKKNIIKKKKKMKKSNLLKQMEQRKKTEERILNQSKRSNSLIKLAMKPGGIGMTSPQPHFKKSLIRTIRRDGDSKYFRDVVPLKQILDVEKSNLFYWCTNEILKPLLYIINNKELVIFKESNISFNFINNNNLKEIYSPTPKFSNKNSLFNRLINQNIQKNYSQKIFKNSNMHQNIKNLNKVKSDNLNNNMPGIKKTKNQNTHFSLPKNHHWKKYSISKIKNNASLMKSNINPKDLAFAQKYQFSFGSQKMQKYHLHHFKPLFVYSNQSSEIIISNFSKQISSQQKNNKYYSKKLKNKLSKNNNNLYKKSSLSTLHLINQEYNFLILSSYDNGIIKVWKNVLSTNQKIFLSNPPQFSLNKNSNIISQSTKYIENLETRNSNLNYKLQIIDSWNGLLTNIDGNDNYSSDNNIDDGDDNGGIITDWLQPQSKLGVAGNNGIINIWDINYQKITNQFLINTKKNKHEIINSLKFINNNTIIAGTKNGSILQYDLRQNNNNNPTFHLSTKDNSLTNICFSHTQVNEIVTATKNRLIQFWDIRLQKNYFNSFHSQGKGLLNCFQSHESLPIFASVTDLNEISIFDKNNNPIPNLNKKKFSPSKFGKIKQIQFHPYQTLLTVSSDSNFSILGLQNKNKFKSNKFINLF
ncbi:regulatory-associated protein of mtor [Anaeramoeba flamelloides]|uniref:Regulatory-associated protein of mtor n=1 Tax=Anaeramoeba flamelloides TaxID=1746091 RepID=A0AAV7ZCF9_9EUKA|nr:regulatory-associated protein of mtor [Anaeramoeba flamelloides]